MIALWLAGAAYAAPPVFRPVLMFEGDAHLQPDPDVSETGVSIRRFYVGGRAELIDGVRAAAVVDLAGESPRILDANLAWQALPALELSFGQAKTPLFPSAHDQPIDSTPLPELPLVVGAMWPGRDAGAEAHLAGEGLPIEAWARLGNGSGNAAGNDNRKPALDARLDAAFGRQRLGSDRASTLGARIGAGVHAEDAGDRGAIAGRTVDGFTYWRPPTVSGPRLVVEGHALVDAGPVRATIEGAWASESRSADTDGDPSTPREALASVASEGASVEVAWMLTGEHRATGAWPCPDDRPRPALEASVRGEALLTGQGPADVVPGGAKGGAIGVRAWWPFGVALAAEGEALAFDVAPLETPGDRLAWTALARATFRAR